MLDDEVPILCESVSPPVIRGAAPLAAALAAGTSIGVLLAGLAGPFNETETMLAASMDMAILAFLMGKRELGIALQRDALTCCSLFRVEGGPVSATPLRVLAIAAPGDLQMNMPIEFITAHLDVRLDLLFVRPDGMLPDSVPDHDVAFCVVSDSDPAALIRLGPLLRRWPRPVINPPWRVAGGRIEDLTRDGIARLFADTPSVHAPPTACLTRNEIERFLSGGEPIDALLPDGAWPLLVRPVGSHAGTLLERLDDTDQLKIYVGSVSAERFYVSRFIDYRDPDGMFRKLRVALIRGRPFLCHMAVSSHWMIHYLNAGMEGSAEKRSDEAAAMADFPTGFARRHADWLAEISRRLGMDYVLLDCAEGPDGRLLLFEVEMAAIIHLLDSAELFPYKPPQMRKVFAAFADLLRAAKDVAWQQ